MSLPRSTTDGAAHTRAAVSSTTTTTTTAATAAAVPIPIRDRARAYLARLPVSVQGQGGHDAAFRAACVLVNGFALADPEALPLLLEWNAQCLPPWTEAELRHKLRSAAQNPGGKPRGHLLEKSFSSSSSRQPGTRKPQKPACEAQALQFDPLTHDDIRAIAALRGIYPDAVDLAHRWGFLKMATVEGHRCFILQEGGFAQARRLDGRPFRRPDGTQLKAKNLPGSQGAFIGKGWLTPHPQITHVLLVEGCIGLLEALAAFCLVDMKEAWCILAATSASSRFARDPALLEALRGRHVRILPDADPAGLNAAMSWAGDLRQAGIPHDAFRLPDGCKDLGDLLALPEGDPRRQSRLKDLFTGH